MADIFRNSFSRELERIYEKYKDIDDTEDSGTYLDSLLDSQLIDAKSSESLVSREKRVSQRSIFRFMNSKLEFHKLCKILFDDYSFEEACEFIGIDMQ